MTLLPGQRIICSMRNQPSKNGVFLGYVKYVSDPPVLAWVKLDGNKGRYKMNVNRLKKEKP